MNSFFVNIGLSSSSKSSFSKTIVFPIYCSASPFNTYPSSNKHSLEFSGILPDINTGVFMFSLYSITLHILSFSLNITNESFVCIPYDCSTPSISWIAVISSSVSPNVEIILISYKLLLSTYLSKLSNISGLDATKPEKNPTPKNAITSMDRNRLLVFVIVFILFFNNDFFIFHHSFLKF